MILQLDHLCGSNMKLITSWNILEELLALELTMFIMLQFDRGHFWDTRMYSIKTTRLRDRSLFMAGGGTEEKWLGKLNFE